MCYTNRCSIIPIDVVDVCNTPPRPADSNGIIIVKLKRKFQYRGHVCFESVRPNFMQNLLYHDTEIDLGNISGFLHNEESQDSLSINVINNVIIGD